MTWERSGGYPVPGAERATSIAWTVLDEMASQTMMHGAIREALYVRLGVLVEEGNQEAANQVLHAFLDCWSMGAIVDDAREQWWVAKDAGALVVLVRAAEIIGLALGWKKGPAGPWPVPDDSWFKAKDRDWVSPTADETSRIVAVSSDDFVLHNAEWKSRILSGEIHSIHLTGRPSAPHAFALAVEELSVLSPCQHAFNCAGFAARYVSALPRYGSGWMSPAVGKMGERLVARADGVVVPALGTGAPMAMVGWILWEAAHQPVQVHPIAVAVLKELDGQTSSSEAASKLDLPLQRWDDIVESLVAMGAVTAA